MKIAIALLFISIALAACRLDEPPGNTAATQNGMPNVVFYDVGARPRAIAVARLDGDSFPDVAVANAGDGTVTILLGDAAGRLRAAGSFAAGGEPSDVDALDIDRDGDADLVFANHETAHITVLLNDGRGGFTRAAFSPLDTGARPHIHGVATGDFNNDGWPDIAVESADTREVRVHLGTPTGFAAPVSINVGTMPYSRLGSGDATGDGTLDILVPGHGDSTIRVIDFDGGGLRLSASMIRLSRTPWMVVAGDVNSDGRSDVIVVETDAVSTWLASASGFVRAPGSPYAIPGATEVAVGDIDGDGAADIAVAPWDGDEVTLIFGRSGDVSRVRMCARPVGLAIADLDRDGHAEVLATCTLTNKLAVANLRR